MRAPLSTTLKPLSSISRVTLLWGHKMLICLLTGCLPLYPRAPPKALSSPSLHKNTAELKQSPERSVLGAPGPAGVRCTVPRTAGGGGVSLGFLGLWGWLPFRPPLFLWLPSPRGCLPSPRGCLRAQLSVQCCSASQRCRAYFWASCSGWADPKPCPLCSRGSFCFR